MRYSFVFLWVAAFVSTGIAQEKPAQPPAATAPAAITPDPGKTAEQILADFKASLATFKTYHCKFESFNRVGEKSDQKLLEIWFKQPGQVRSLVLKGDNEGGLATRDAKGALRGRKGGVLSLVTLNLKEDDERLRGIRGKKFYDAAWDMILKDFTSRIEKGWKLERLPDEKVAGELCYVIATTGTETRSKDTGDRLHISPKTGALIQRTEYQGTTKVSGSLYTEIKLNPPLADELFHL